MKPAARRTLLSAGFAAGVFLCAFPAQAALLNVSCTTSGSNLVFGNYAPFSTSATDITGTITVACSATVNLTGGTVSYTIALGAGNSGSYATRKLNSGVNTLNYNLYTSSGYGTVWGDGTGGSVTVSGSGTVSLLVGSFSNDATVYGRIPALQVSTVPGSYNDTITITVTY